MNDDRVAIVFRPEALDYETFHRLDTACFTTEPPLSYEAFVHNVASEFWAAYVDDALIGYGYLRGADHPAWIARLAVAETTRNRGVGGRLMGAMLEHCRAKGAEEAILYVMQNNEPAVHLYRKHGFDVADETYQYLVPATWIAAHSGAGGDEGSANGGTAPSAEGSGAIRAVPIDSIPSDKLPRFADQWSAVPGHHNPPNVYVFVFRDPDDRNVGYASFSPNFPGCFPFVVDDPERDAEGAIASLAPYLAPDKDPIRLTFSSAELSAACDTLGLELNYTLYKMATKL
jgi:ribosomal protein S18 acetylase RimI-like enzyme